MGTRWEGMLEQNTLSSAWTGGTKLQEDSWGDLGDSVFKTQMRISPTEWRPTGVVTESMGIIREYLMRDSLRMEADAWIKENEKYKAKLDSGIKSGLQHAEEFVSAIEVHADR